MRGADNVERKRVWVNYFISGKPLSGVYCEKQYIPGDLNPDKSGKDAPLKMVVFGLFRRTVKPGEPAESGQVIRHEKLIPGELVWAAEMISWLRRECMSKGIAFERGDDRRLGRTKGR